MSFQATQLIGFGAVPPATASFSVTHSGSFNGSAYLVRTPTSPNRKKWTFSAWIKKSGTGVNDGIWSFFDGIDIMYIRITGGDALRFHDAGATIDKNTNATYSSTATWYHVVVAVDTDQGTAANRNRIYVNGTEVTSFSIDSNSGSSSSTFVNKAMQVGGDADLGDNFNGLIAEVAYIDGQQLTPASFASGGAPIDLSGLTFGANGYWLQFKNSGALGTDSSPNAFTLTNSGVTQSASHP